MLTIQSLGAVPTPPYQLQYPEEELGRTYLARKEHRERELHYYIIAMVYLWAYMFFDNRAGSNSEKGKRERAPELYGWRCMDGTRGEMEIRTLWNEKDSAGLLYL